MSSRFITAALAPTLALGLAGLGPTATATAAPVAAAVAAADRTGAWSAPTALTGPESVAEIIDVRATTDGDAVAVWYGGVAATRQQELRVAVRPATSTQWGPAEVLATLPEGRESVLLVPSPDGSAAVTWVHAGKDGSVLRTATLAKGATSWSAPVDIATAPAFGEVAFAGGPTGKGVVTWRQNEGRRSLLLVSERSGPDGTWSEPAELVGDGASWPQALVAADGAVTVAWADNVAEGMTVKAVTKAAGATGWSAPVLVSAPYEGGAPVLSQGPDGTAALAWVAHQWLGDDAGSDIDVISSVRAPGGSEWGALHTIQSDSFSKLRAPLVGPDGDVTLVWIDHQGTLGLRTASRTAATGTWTEVRTLSDGAVSEEFDAKIGADGTVRAGWVQDDETGKEGTAFHTAARVDGAWTPRTQLSEEPSDYSVGSVAVGPDGNATAVWVQDDRLWTAATGLTTEPPAAPAARRDYVGADGFPDLYARTATGALIIYRGNASKVVSAKADGGVWPATSVLVPFGDLDGDGCNDTLVRDSSGELHLATPACGTPVTPQSPSVAIGTGWNAFDGYSYSGDLDGDGIPDLVARQIATGDLYLYAGTETGRLTRVGRIGTGWKSLTIVGAGDLNGDGTGDIVARTATGDLYRYYGSGTGALGSGVKIGTGWNGMVDIVGIGDLTGDGKDDLVARTTAGDLYRYAGNGAGGVVAGVKIGTGWKSIRSVG